MRRFATILLALSVIAISPRAFAANKLWLVWDAGTANCKSQVTDFFNCILNDSNFNQLAGGYSGGEALTLAGTHTLSVSCGATAWDCIEGDAKFALTKYDVLLHFYGSSWQGGTNGTTTVSNVPGVGSVFVNTAWVQSGTNCNGQTCTGAHEAYEAATDGKSADCCNGQTLNDSCSKCPTSCAVYHGNNGNPPWGCYDLQCPNGMYKMELLSPATAEFDPNACEKLKLTGSCNAVDTACSADTDCCSGLSCKYWDYDGKEPYSTNCCKVVGSDCGGDTDCCGGSNCTGGKCACVDSGKWCINADECCAGLECDLSAHQCVAAATDAGSGGSAGSGTAGATGSGGAKGGNGGWAATDAGSVKPGSGGKSATGPDATPDDSAGCSCRTAGGRSEQHTALGFVLLVCFLSVRRGSVVSKPHRQPTRSS